MVLGKKSPVVEWPRQFLAAVFLFFGLSGANAVGGALQVAFFCVSIFISLLNRRRFPVKELLLVLICGCVAALASLRGEQSLLPLVKFFRPFFEGYIISLLLYGFFGVRSFQALAGVLAVFIGLQFLSACAMLALPDVRIYVLDALYSDDSYGESQAFRAALLFRGYGISKHHLYGFPLAVGTISALLMVAASMRAYWKRRLVLSVAAFMGLMLVLINGRIGIVPILFCYAFGSTLFYRRYILRQLLLFVIVVAPIVILLARLYLGDAAVAIFDWLIEGGLQFFDSADNAESTTVNDLGSMIVLPTNLVAWVFGEGRICSPGESCYADIGWIRLLQEGGLLLVLAVLALYTRIILRIPGDSGRGHGAKYGGLLRWTLFVTFFAATVKGDSFAANDFSRLLMMLALWSSYLPRGKSIHVARRDGSDAPVSLAGALT